MKCGSCWKELGIDKLVCRNVVMFLSLWELFLFHEVHNLMPVFLGWCTYCRCQSFYSPRKCFGWGVSKKRNNSVSMWKSNCFLLLLVWLSGWIFIALVLIFFLLSELRRKKPDNFLRQFYLLFYLLKATVWTISHLILVWSIFSMWFWN